MERKKCQYHICNKKLGHVPFKCRCENEYCIFHRLPEKHECTTKGDDFSHL